MKETINTYNSRGWGRQNSQRVGERRKNGGRYDKSRVACFSQTWDFAWECRNDNVEGQSNYVEKDREERTLLLAYKVK